MDEDLYKLEDFIIIKVQEVDEKGNCDLIIDTDIEEELAVISILRQVLKFKEDNFTNDITLNN